MLNLGDDTRGAALDPNGSAAPRGARIMHAHSQPSFYFRDCDTTVMIERRSETLQILPRQAKDGRRGNTELVCVHVRGGNRLGCATTRSTSVSN